MAGLLPVLKQWTSVKDVPVISPDEDMCCDCHRGRSHRGRTGWRTRKRRSRQLHRQRLLQLRWQRAWQVPPRRAAFVPLRHLGPPTPAAGGPPLSTTGYARHDGLFLPNCVPHFITHSAAPSGHIHEESAWGMHCCRVLPRSAWLAHMHSCYSSAAC